MTTGDATADLVLEGSARRITGPDLVTVAAAYAAKYDWAVDIRDDAFWADGAPTAGPPPFHVFAVDPAVAYAFPIDGVFPATRWTFT